ncbi:MAG: alpha/beta hydrolase [Sphingobacteriales bacterium]|jgi:pimeloyl-ACP methyl ester carboxylesterase|nr:alpha/beta hydrolase [Sphingobacteriales bacterium]
MQKTINVDGTDVHIQGEHGKTILFIHGWPDTHEIWQKQVYFFKKDFRCVTFTLPGFDKRDNGKYTLDDIIHRIRNIADAVSPDSKVILVIHDWGCVFGYEYAMRYPEKIDKMVAIDVGDTSSPGFKKTLTLKSKLMVFSYQFTLALGWLTKSNFVHKAMAKGLKARSNFDNIHAGMGLPYAMRWIGANGGMKALQPVKPTFPFFYIYALRKPFFFQTKNWLDELVKNPDNKVQAFDCGHWVMVDKAAEFNEVVGNWLKK